MPPLGLHTAVAKEVADRLRHRLLQDEAGSLYLGSTAPDIRIITRWERERTHFFDLSRFDEQQGVQGLFEAYPRLARPSELKGATAAFVAGYISHLVMDETWINDVYRPYFGERSALGGGIRANIMDRALQFSLDSEKRGDKELMGDIVAQVARCELALEIDFIDGDTIRRWREVVLDVVNRSPDWERFRYAAGRHLGQAVVESPELIEEYMRSLPDLVEETLRYLTPERVHAFAEEALGRSLEAVREYLECV